MNKKENDLVIESMKRYRAIAVALMKENKELNAVVDAAKEFNNNIGCDCMKNICCVGYLKEDVCFTDLEQALKEIE